MWKGRTKKPKQGDSPELGGGLGNGRRKEENFLPDERPEIA